MTDAPTLEKRLIRETVGGDRAARPLVLRNADRARLTIQLSSLVESRGARSVTCYLPLANEPDTSGFIEWAVGRGIDVLLPVAHAHSRLEWARLDHSGSPSDMLASTVAGRHGILEPAGPRLPIEAASQVDLMLIPACAVDLTGNRLGWGLGYYDRALAVLSPRPPVYAVVHTTEILPHIPTDPHDVPVTGAVTPDEIRVFSTGPG